MSKEVLFAFLNMQPRSGDRDAQTIMTVPELRAKIILQIEQYPAVALPNTDKPVMIAGAVLNDEFAELWMVAGAGFEKQLYSLIRQLRHLLTTAREAFAPREIKIAINPDRPGTVRFARALGFVFEKSNATHVYTLNQKGK